MDVDDLIGLARTDRLRESPPLARPHAAGGAVRAPSLRQRLRGHARAISFLACVVLPGIAAAGYEYGCATGQYVSEFKLLVRQQAPETSGQNSIMSALGGGNPMLAMIEDSEVVQQYIGSHQILADLPPGVSLDRIFATRRADWFSRLAPGLPPEQQLLYWRKMVHPYFDLSSGVITVQVRAFSPRDALTLANVVLSSSEALVNQMSLQARQNSLAYAGQTADAAQAALLADEANLASYRNQYSVLFPELTAASTSSVDEGLSSRLAEDQATLASLTSLGQTDASPQVQTLRARIAATQAEISHVGAALASAGGGTQTLATVLSGYNTLVETEKLDEELYDSDLLNLQNARNSAAQKSIYLETFVQPNLPVVSTYPVRWLATAETALAGFIAWVLLTLVVNIIRDQVD
jgi:capsular polysaccharide transport system permease protein